MDLAYLHLITNHIPIIGVPLGIFLLVLGWWQKSDDLKAAAFLIFSFLGLMTLITFWLGQSGEDFVEELAGVSHDAIHAHEDFAKIALAVVATVSIFSSFALLRYQSKTFWRRRITDANRLIEGEISSAPVTTFPNWIVLAVLVLALASSAVLGYTGKLGGKIRHAEFYGGAQNVEDGEKKRRGRNDQNADALSSETVPTTDKNEETNEESGKKRRRGGRR